MPFQKSLKTQTIHVKIENPNSQEKESEGTPSRLFFLDRGVGPAKLLSAEIVDPLQLKLRVKVEAIRLVQREESLDKVKKISTLDIGIGAEMTLSKTAILDSVSAN